MVHKQEPTNPTHVDSYNDKQIKILLTKSRSYKYGAKTLHMEML